MCVHVQYVHVYRSVAVNCAVPLRSSCTGAAAVTNKLQFDQAQRGNQPIHLRKDYRFDAARVAAQFVAKESAYVCTCTHLAMHLVSDFRKCSQDAASRFNTGRLMRRDSGYNTQCNQQIN